MGMADDMKNLGEDIIASYDLRVKAIGELASDVHKMLNGFQAEHKEMAANLRDGLAKGETERLKDFKSMVADIQKAIKEIEAYTANKLKEFNTAHAEMAANLRDGLAKGETERLKDFESMMAEIRKVIKDSETDIKNKLKEFSAARADMSAQIKKDLAEYVSGVVSETENLLKDYREEREKMAANWQTLTAKMAKKGGIKPRVEAEVKVRTVEEAVEEEKPPIEEVVEEEKPPIEEVVEEEKPPIEEVVEEEKPLEEKIVEFIERHPEGVRIGDMEEPMGIPRTRLGVIAKSLLVEGKVRKEGVMYFPL